MKLIRISPNKSYIFMPEFIWDGISDDVLRNHAITVNNGIIDSFGPVSDIYSDSGTTRCDNIEIITLPGTTLMPGLIDCHVHLAMNCIDLLKAVEDWETSLQHSINRARSYLEEYLYNGIIAIRDGGDKVNIGLKTRNMVRYEDHAAPEIVATGRAIYKKGMYGSFLGPGISSVEEALNQVEQFKAEGIDQIKVAVSGLISFKSFGSVGSLQFTLEELKAIVEKAHAVGLKVMAHASSAQAVETSVLAGTDSVEHGYFLEQHQLELMAQHKTAWVPTLAPLGNLVKENIIPYPGANLDIIKRSFERQLAMVHEASTIGVTLGVGTDAGANQVFHGYSYHNELAYYAEAGLDKSTILKMATSISAGIIGKDNYLGIISAGKQPFWCCISGNPFRNLELLKTPEAVIIPE